MNDDPSSVDVLYANIHIVGQETNHQIQQLSNEIIDYFHKHGVLLILLFTTHVNRLG